MLVHYVVALSLTACILVGVAIFVARKGLPGSSSRLFVQFTLAIAWWSGLEAVAITTMDPARALWLWRLSYVGVIFIPVCFWHFLVDSLNLGGWAQRSIRWHYMIGLVFLAANATPWLIARTEPKFDFRNFAEPGFLHYPFFAWWMALATACLWVLWRAQQRARGVSKTQLQYLCLGTLIGYAGGAPNFLPVFDIELFPLNPFATYGVPIYVLVTAYAVVNVRLMEMRLALARGLLLAGIYTAVMGIPIVLATRGERWLQRALGERWWLAPLLLSTVLAVVWPFVYYHLRHGTEERLMGEQRGYQRALMQASLGMTRVRHAQTLLKLIVSTITRSARIRHAALFLKDRRTNHYQLAVERQYHVLRHGETFPNEEVIVKRLRAGRAPLVTEELRLQSRAPAASVRANMQLALELERLDIAVIIPSFIEEELFGFLMLGPKRSGQLYTASDLEVFATLANHAALAIENALSFEELQQTQAQLFQAQKMGTLGQMASGMSHQIHNRLTVLSLAAQNARINAIPRLEEVLRKVVGLPPDVPRAMDELRHLYQVIEDESNRGSQIVRGLLDYSKPSAKHEPLTLKPLLEKAINMLQYKHELTKIRLVQEVNDDLPPIFGNRSHLQDAFFNVLDNACDAVEARHKYYERVGSSGADSYQPEIRISAVVIQQGGQRLAQVTISDNGLGMTPEELSQLFIPFFTTKATSVKGTGLGLFIIQKILEAHGGRIRATSELNRGTLFIVEMPLA